MFNAGCFQEMNFGIKGLIEKLSSGDETSSQNSYSGQKNEVTSSSVRSYEERKGTHVVHPMAQFKIEYGVKKAASGSECIICTVTICCLVHRR